MEEKHDNPWKHGPYRNRKIDSLIWGVVVLAAATVLHLILNK
jgi:hypothetical protein